MLKPEEDEEWLQGLPVVIPGATTGSSKILHLNYRKLDLSHHTRLTLALLEQNPPLKRWILMKDKEHQQDYWKKPKDYQNRPIPI